MGGEALGGDAVKGREGAQAGRGGRIAGRADLDGGDHQVLGGMFGRDELEYLGPVAGPFEQLGAQGVGDEFRVTFLENSMAQRVGQHGRGGELGAEFLLAAGGNDDERRARGNALGERVVRGGVAGVQGDEDVRGIFDFRISIFD